MRSAHDRRSCFPEPKPRCPFDGMLGILPEYLNFPFRREFSAVLKEEEAEAEDALSTVRFTNGEMRLIAEAMRDGIMYNEIMKDEMRSRTGMGQSVLRFQETVRQYTRVMQNHGLKELIDYGV